MARVAQRTRRKIQKTSQQKGESLIFYHITTPEKWAEFKDKDFYEAESLKTEGFIHASFSEQLEETLKIYYQDAREVLILTVDSEKLTSKLIVEKSRKGEDFPHIYGVINKSAIVRIETRILNPRGSETVAN